MKQVDLLSKQVEGLEEQAREKYQNFTIQEYTQGNGQGAGLSNDPLSVIQKKLEEQDKKWNEMKDNIKILDEKTIANSMTMQLQDTQINHLMIGQYPPLADYTMGDFEDESKH